MRSGTISVAIVGVLITIVLSGCSAIAEPHRALFGSETTRQISVTQDEDPISGEWNVTFYDHGNTISSRFTFKLEGKKVTGTVFSDRTSEGTIRDGEWSNGKLSFAADFKEHKSLVVTGTLRDGKFAGECHHPEGPTFKWEARRK
jgi:hypothetical protein